MIGNFKSTTQINERNFRKMCCQFKQYFQTLEEYLYVFYIAPGVHMNSLYMQAGCFYNSFNMPHLMYRYTKFAINMSGGNFIITTSHDVRIETDTDRITAPVFIAKPFQHGDIINIHIHPNLFSFLYFSKIN